MPQHLLQVEVVASPSSTSRLSPYLHFGCISSLEAAVGAGEVTTARG
jgi:deoxyribodipyrimidine photolyase